MEGEVRSFGLAKKPIARNLPVLASLETHSYLNHLDSFRCCCFSVTTWPLIGSPYFSKVGVFVRLHTAGDEDAMFWRLLGKGGLFRTDRTVQTPRGPLLENTREIKLSCVAIVL